MRTAHYDSSETLEHQKRRLMSARVSRHACARHAINFPTAVCLQPFRSVVATWVAHLALLCPAIHRLTDCEQISVGELLTSLEPNSLKTSCNVRL